MLKDMFFRMPMKLAAGTTAYTAPSFFPQKQSQEAELRRQRELNEKWNSVRDSCDKCRETLQNCTTDEDCGTASVALQLCISKIVCPSVAEDFATAVEELKAGSLNDDKLSQRYVSITKCLEDFELDSRQKAR